MGYISLEEIEELFIHIPPKDLRNGLITVGTTFSILYIVYWLIKIEIICI